MSFHPQTPQSPSHLSPTMTDSQSGASFGTAVNTTSTNANTSYHSGSFSTTTPASGTLPTPAHSVNGSGFGQSDVGPNEDSPQKRKRAFDDTGDQQTKKVHTENNAHGQHKLDFAALHQDVGEKYLVCKTHHEPSFPPLAEDLFARFNLTGIAAEVARTLPNGEKNAMRKTYKGYMKKLGVSGHFEPVKREDGEEGDLLRLVSEAEDSWQARQVKTKDIRDGLGSDVAASLRRAMTMSKGPLPKTIWDSTVLGDLAPDKLTSLGAKPSSVRGGTAPNTPLHPSISRTKSQQPSSLQQTNGGPDSMRPRRINKKRGYGDNSFEGYGEGFPDDDGYSTGEGDGPSHKRRKKNATPTAQYSQAPVRQQSYGPGMVGA